MDTWIANGTVWSTATVGDTLYLGGSFTELSPPTGNGIAVDATTGARDETLPEVLGTVRAVAPSSSGGWYVGGSFTLVGGQARGGLAYIKPDGAVASWNPKPVGGRVLALALSPDGSTLYVGGSFTTLKGQPRAGLASFSSATNQMTSWAPAVSGGYVNAIAVSPDGTTVYAGGTFLSVDGSARSRLAAFDASTGSLSPDWHPDANGEVLALAADAGNIYAGGSFSTLDGDTRNGLGAISAAGSVVTWTGSGADGAVRALAVSGSRVFAGGDFSTLDGEARPFLGSVDPATGEADAWAPSPDASVLALSPVSSGSIAVAGNFLSVGSEPARRLALLDTATGLSPEDWAPNPNATVRALALSVDGSIYFAGGSFTGAGGVLRERLAAIDLTTGEPTAWAPSADKDAYALAASPDGSVIYAGGNFSKISGSSRTKLAAIDAATGTLDATFKISANRRIKALATMGTFLYVGGDFTKLGGLARARLAAIDTASETVITGWDPGADAMVRTLLVTPSDGRLYAGGDFEIIGGIDRDHVAALDAATGTIVSSFAPWGPRHRTFQLAADASRVYAAMGGPGGGRLRAYSIPADGDLVWEAMADGDVQAVAVAGGLVYIGGHFDTLLGAPRGSSGAADATTGALDDWNPRANGSLWSLSADTTRVYAGGDFTKVGVSARQGVAAFA
jgi:DNA-binding beta-propeller fold protein YncE